jgi:two-component system, sensor histidine kinase and response regulator
LELGAIDFIRKPIEPDELVARVQSLLRLKLSIDEKEKVARQREDFVSRLTHDLRTPLVASDRMLNLLLKNAFGEMPEAAQNILEIMICSNQTLIELVNMLLEVYRYQAGKKPLTLMPVNMPEMIQKVIRELAPLASTKGLQLEADLEQLNTPAEERITVVIGDYLELHRVIINIIGNAIKFTDQGTVEVRLSSLQSLNEDKSCLGWSLIEVKDTGLGIAASDQAAIFEEFSRGAHSQAGTGLGLTLSLHIVEAHKGKIEVQSQLGKGSTFKVFLPEK